MCDAKGGSGADVTGAAGGGRSSKRGSMLLRDQASLIPCCSRVGVIPITCEPGNCCARGGSPQFMSGAKEVPATEIGG
jgi:hypothetical protein